MVVGLDNYNSGKEIVNDIFGFNPMSPLEFTNFKTAEFVKYVDNAYHATKVVFANEIYSIGSNLGVDVQHANKIFLMDKKLNISEKYLRPGTPFGGSCLPKDTRAILKLAQQADVTIPFFNGLIQSNKEHQKRLLEKVMSFGKNKVLIYGLTFKQNTDDIRESPFLFLLNDLVSSGIEVLVYDSDLNLLNVRLDFPQLSRYIKTDLKECVEWSEVIILNKHDYLESLKGIAENKTMLNCLDNEDHSNNYSKCVNLY